MLELIKFLMHLLLGARWRGMGSLTDPNGGLDEIVDRQYEEERKSERTDAIVGAFKSDTEPVHGAVDYDEMRWNFYDKVIETPEQFVFYNGQSTQKIIAKSAFTNRQEIVTLRRVIHRYVRNCELRDD